MDPEEIEKRQFVVSLRGYARDEVETFREEVAQEIKILRKQLTKANSELSHAGAELAKVKAQLAEASVQLAEERSRRAQQTEPKAPEPAPAEDRASVFRKVGQETERILLAAEHAAEQIHDRAVAESAEIMADARARVEQTLTEFEAARRAAEEDFAGIRDSRAMVASQLEDIRRRLEETIGRLRVPVELPGSKPVSRFRQAETASKVPIDRRLADAQAQQRHKREIEAAQELQARQTAHRGEADRREEELKAVQAEAERRSRAEAERQARDRAATEAAAKKAQQAAEMQAAVSAAQEAERLKNAREVERQQASEAASAAMKARADEQAAAAAKQKAETERAEAKAKAEAGRKAAEQAEAEKSAKAKAEADRVSKAIADAEAAARTAGAEDQSADKQAAPPKPAGQGGSSLDELLAEIRRKREEEERQARTESETGSGIPEEPEAAGRDEALARRSEVLGDLPAQTARRLKRLLQEDHNDLLDRLRTQRGKGPLEDNLSSQDEQIKRFVAGLNEALGRAFAEGRKAGGAGNDTDPAAAITKLVTRQVVTPLRSEVSKAVEAGLAAEDSASALSERVNDVFRVWKGVRTQLLGEGIAYSAYHQGLLDIWRTKAGSTKRWVFSDDEADCPNETCRRNADKGAVAVKEAFPSGHLAPPAHGGCTCTLKSG